MERDYYVAVSTFRDADEMNEELRFIPGDEILNVILQPGIVAVVHKKYTEPKQEPKKVLTEGVSKVPAVEYDSTKVSELMSLVGTMGIETCVELLKYLQDNGVYSTLCLSRLLGK